MVNQGVFSGLEIGTTTWMTVNGDSGPKFSIAGYWSVCVTIPVIQFIIIRWFWFYMVWILLLFRFSKTNLKLLTVTNDKKI